MMDSTEVVNRRVVWPLLCVLLVCAVKLRAQPVGHTEAAAEYVPTMTFDVASVRESNPDWQLGVTVSGAFEPSNSSRLTLTNNGLMNLLIRAYGVNPNSIEGIPRELWRRVFNVEARSDPANDEKLAKLTKEQVRLEQQHMVQVLLAERFHLKAHWEERVIPTYELVVAKPGRLKTTGPPPTEEVVRAYGSRGVPPITQNGSSMRGFEYIAYGATGGEIANLLTGQFGRTVFDRTGLTGKYYFHLRTYQVKSEDRKLDEPNPWPPLENAMREELGLKLVPSRHPVKILVIDHIELPTEN